MHLILVRHPKPLCEPGLCYGRLDLACEPEALAEAGEKLRSIARGYSIVSSPARRAGDLARQLSDAVIFEPRLQELDFGEWEGRHWSNLGRAAIDTWREGLPYAAPPGGESLSSLAARCGEWLAHLDHDAPPVLALTHAGPIRVMRALMEGKPLLHYFTASVPYAQPLRLKTNPKWNLGTDKILSF